MGHCDFNGVLHMLPGTRHGILAVGVELCLQGFQLPDGWTVEERTRKKGAKKGRKYNVFTAPCGKKVWSTAEARKHLAVLKG